MRARDQGSGDLLGGQHGPDRQAVRQGLGKGHDIRFDPHLLIGEQGPGPADTGLDLVKDQEQAVLSAEILDPPEVLGGQRAYPALALQRFTENGAGPVADHPGNGLQVTEGGMHKALGERLKALVEFGLAGGGHGRQGPAMERAGQGNDLVAPFPGLDAGQLDRRLVGLGPAVGEKDLVGEGMGDQQFGQLGLRPGNMHQFSGLAADRLGDGRMAVTEGADRNPREKIKVLPTVRVSQETALTLDHGRRKTGIGADKDPIGPGPQFFVGYFHQ